MKKLIPLTIEFLIKFGFVPVSDDCNWGRRTYCYKDVVCYQNPELTIFYLLPDAPYNPHGFINRPVKYVHQLKYYMKKYYKL